MESIEHAKEKRTSSKVAAKAGIWYTVCNFLFKGMVFLTTPIFTRLMSKDELGNFSNFSAWASILLIVTSFDLSQSIIRSKLEHENDMDRYVWSILAFSTIWTAVVYGLVCVFSTFFVDLFQTEMKFIHIMFLYLFTAPPYIMLITKHRAFYKYKLFAMLTGIMTISGTTLSVVLVLLLQDKLAARIWGYYIPYILIGAVIFIHLFMKGKRINIGYWKYACMICIPLVPHVLSLYLLSSSDKVIITRLCGAEYTALYSVAYSAYHIVTILFDSMNKAWAPWLLESLHYKKYTEIRKLSKIYIAIFVLLITAVLLFVPEIVWILGGKQYAGAVYCLPPLITSCVFQFIYTMYVNIEFYEKKTFGVSIATMLATAINIVLNLIFIPMNPNYSYVIAAYTTLAGYIILFIFHFFIVKKMKMAHVYDIRFIVGILGVAVVTAGAMNILYKMGIWRYMVIGGYGACVIYFAYRYKGILGLR